MTGQAANKAQDEDDEDVHRLREIVAEEVSLVDRAANKRRFLLLKRDGMTEPNAVGAEVTSDGEGGLTAATTDEGVEKVEGSGDGGDSGETDKAGEDREQQGKAGHIDEEEERRRRGKQKLTIPGPVKTAITRTLTQASERLASVLEKVKAAETTDEQTSMPVPAEIGRELGQAMNLVRSVGEKYPSPSAKSAGEGDGDAEGTDVEKRGARMARARMSQLEGAVKMLSELVKELRNEQRTSSVGKSDGKTVVNKSEPESPTQPASAQSEVLATVGAVAKTVESLSRVVKSQGAKLALMSKGVPQSNAIPVNGSGSEESLKEVAWPMDMNRPIDRDTVRKEHWFEDEQ